MNTKLTSEHASVKAEITVIFKTGDLMDKTELSEKYNGDIKQAVIEMISQYSLFDLIEEKYVIDKVNIIG